MKFTLVVGDKENMNGGIMFKTVSYGQLVHMLDTVKQWRNLRDLEWKTVYACLDWNG